MDRYGNATEYNSLYQNAKKSQREMILEYLYLYGSITPLEAIIGLGCYRLGARIWDLRKEGFNIVTETDPAANYAIYKLN